MSRIFNILATFALLFVLATMVLGYSLRARDIRDAGDTTAQRMATLHRLSGVAAGIVVVFVNSLVVTYFIGTSRWCKEVCETYRLDGGIVRRSTVLKRKTFPIAVVNMLIAVAIIALGGASDPGGTFRVPPPAGLTWTNLHFLSAAVGLLALGYGSWFEAGNIRANHQIIAEVMEEVHRIRTERGME